jgi:phosphatidylglycerol:prolipoprotein diacylglycerol transferase
MVLDLSPYAFKLGPIAVHWYGIFMALSFLVGSYYLLKMGKKIGIDEDFILNLAMIVIVAGVIGARLVFVLSNYPQWFITEPFNVIKVWEGGLAWHGGLLGGLLAGWAYCKKHGVNPNVLADWTVVGLSFGYIIVRIGNIFNQEVLGRMTQFSFGRWPAQLIGSSIGVVLLLRFIYLQKKGCSYGISILVLYMVPSVASGFYRRNSAGKSAIFDKICKSSLGARTCHFDTVVYTCCNGYCILYV